MYLCVLLKCYLQQTKEKKKTYQASEKLGHEDHWRTYIVTQNNKCYNTATDKMKMYIYIYMYMHVSITYMYIDTHINIYIYHVNIYFIYTYIYIHIHAYI